MSDFSKSNSKGFELSSIKTEAFKDLAKDIKFDTDFSIVFLTKNGRVRINVHKIVLAARSEKFNGIFSKFGHVDPEYNFLEIYGISNDVLKIFLYGMYDKQPAILLTLDQVFELFDMILEYKAISLFDLAMYYLCETLKNLIDFKSADQARKTSKRLIDVYLLWRDCWVGKIDCSVTAPYELKSIVENTYNACLNALNFDGKFDDNESVSDDGDGTDHEASFSEFLDEEDVGHISSKDVAIYVKALEYRKRTGEWQMPSK